MKRRKSQKRYRESGERHSPVAEPPPLEVVPRCKIQVARDSIETERRATVPTAAPATRKPTRLTRTQRYRKAAALLREWMADDSGYDEMMGPLLEEELKKHPIRFREEFE